jgi:hypothetical protein
LYLRINHQRPSLRIVKNDGIINRKGIIRQRVLIRPLTNGNRIAENLLQTKII